jgi:hypothetical protein
MMIKYFQHCTFHVVIKDRAGVLHTQARFVEEGLKNPRAFYDWVTRVYQGVVDESGGDAAILDMKVIPPVVTNFYEEINN